VLDLAQDVEQAEAEYLDDLWFLLHHSEADDCLVTSLTAYFDDSGSDETSSLVTIGGPVMSRIQFKEFSVRWERMLAKHRISAPLHMTDFVRPGKYCTRGSEMKRALFGDVARLTNEHKLYSVSVGVPQGEFKTELSEDVRNNLIGPYGFAFFAAVSLNFVTCGLLKTGDRRISYLVDRGFCHEEQLDAAHLVLVRNEIIKGGFRHIGALTFETDDHVPALQSADAIAWASRRRQLDGALPEGFEPLNELLRDDADGLHAHIQMPREGIKFLADPINSWISRKGGIPRLVDIMRPPHRYEQPDVKSSHED
jgi:Protein of unknown function (DUF3800)